MNKHFYNEKQKQLFKKKKTKKKKKLKKKRTFGKIVLTKRIKL